MDLVLEPRELRILEGVRFNPRNSFTGKVRGERITTKRGVSIEFSDYRDYSDGDDLRHLDWNVLARLEAPIVKTYRDEEDLAVYVLLDSSASMNFGEPSKFALAQKAAAACSLLALASGDALYLQSLGIRTAPPARMRGRGAYPQAANWIRACGSEGTVSLAQSIRQFAGSSVRAGLVILITDGLEPEFPTAIRTLGGRGHEVFLLQILSEEELNPDIEGDLKLIDAENGGSVELTANSFALKQYQAALRQHNEAAREAVLRIGGKFASIHSSDSLEDVFKTTFRKGGWVSA